MNLADKCRVVAAYHGHLHLSVHLQHVEDVVQVQRAALLEAADRLEQLEAEAARLRAATPTLDGRGRVAGIDPCHQEQTHVRDQDPPSQP